VKAINYQAEVTTEVLASYESVYRSELGHQRVIMEKYEVL